MIVYFQLPISTQYQPLPMKMNVRRSRRLNKLDKSTMQMNPVVNVNENAEMDANTKND